MYQLLPNLNGRDVQFCTVFDFAIRHALTMSTKHPMTMNSSISEIDTALTVLEKQGLRIKRHSSHSNTWDIAKGGLHSGYVASGDELIALSRTKKLTMRGILALN
jgi:hypothetical protein